MLDRTAMVFIGNSRRANTQTNIRLVNIIMVMAVNREPSEKSEHVNNYDYIIASRLEMAGGI